MSHVDFKKWQCHMSLSLIFLHVTMSNLRHGHVACHYHFHSPVACLLALYHLSIVRYEHVALSNLRVEGHNSTTIRKIDANQTVSLRDPNCGSQIL